jgi:hypothetical protein
VLFVRLRRIFARRELTGVRHCEVDLGEVERSVSFTRVVLILLLCCVARETECECFPLSPIMNGEPGVWGLPIMSRRRIQGTTRQRCRVESVSPIHDGVRGFGVQPHNGT